MSLRALCYRNDSVRLRVQSTLTTRFFATAAKENDGQVIDLTSLDEKPIYDEDEKINEEVERKRNKSRLQSGHRNMLFDKPPSHDITDWYHDRLKYKRRLLGRYGLENIDTTAGVAWPTPNELYVLKEYERVAYPETIQETWKTIAEKHKKEAEAIKLREQDIAKKLSKLKDWTAELKNKLAKKEADALMAKERKERLIEEVRRHFGFKIDPRDVRFKEMLEKKEKEDKKKQKDIKKKERAAKYMAKLMADNTKGPNADQKKVQESVTPSETPKLAE
ncbi:growth arrest and DNA damage-inducible proteins-interacting protein 1 [Cephus cinctus]|uniref:Large ribosomal subunit protein mL64 n=1 Tax=Cephus cinctus TaxID=211228 RepID=A0AAJ7BW92_CEPCN|nr:growth arrest and DNA damage-inducible proteins-interacting protein 1 [Cephus cinctus]